MKVLLILAFMPFAQLTKAQSNQVTKWIIDTMPTSFTIRFVNFLENSFFIEIWGESRKKIKRIKIESGTTVEINLLSNKWYYIQTPALDGKKITEKPKEKEFFVTGTVIKQSNKKYCSNLVYLYNNTVISYCNTESLP